MPTLRLLPRLLPLSSPPPSLLTHRTMSTASDLTKKLQALHEYSACDVSDALLKLQKPAAGTVARAGHLADLTNFSNPTSKIIAPASTFKFIPKSSPLPAEASLPAHSFPENTHWVDHSEPGTIAVIEQPQGQFCAALGGIMAVRMKYLGVKGVLVDGRVRDLEEVRGVELPVWARGRSTVGTGAETKPGARGVAVVVGGGVRVEPGDIIFCDPLEGVVAIPRDLLDRVLELMPKLVAMDDRVKEAVMQGMSVNDAFKQFRTKI